MRRPRPKELKNTHTFDLVAAIDSNDVPPSGRDFGPEEAGKALEVQPTTAAVKEDQLDPGSADIEPHWDSDDPVSSANVEVIHVGHVVCSEDDVFDKLSKTLEDQASHLSAEGRAREAQLRQRVMESLRGFNTDRAQLSESLFNYKAVFKIKRQWTRVVTEIGEAIGVSARTVFRMIDDYESSRTPQEPAAEVDTSAIQGEKLTMAERNEARARLAIRALLDDIPVNEKARVLADVLGQEAYQVWGLRKEFTFTVKPTESKFTMDGRKRQTQAAAKEVAA